MSAAQQQHPARVGEGDEDEHEEEEGDEVAAESTSTTRRVLYDVLDLSPRDRWTYDAELQEEDQQRAALEERAGWLKRAGWLLVWLWRELLPALLTALGLPTRLVYGAESVRAAVRAAPWALRQHRSLAPEWSITPAPAGDALAILQNRQLSIRYAADNFRITKTTWKVPSTLQDPSTQWRYVAWTVDSKYLAVGVITGHIYVLQRGIAKHTLNIRQMGLGKALAGIAFRRTGTSGRRAIVELIVVTHEGKVWRLPLPKLAIGIDPKSPDVKSLDVSSYHSAIGNVAYHPETDLLAVVGGSNSLTNQANEKGSLSLWKLSEEAPYFLLQHSTSGLQSAEHLAARSTFAPLLRYFSKSYKTKAIYHKAVFSPRGDRVATLDLTGRVDAYAATSPYTQLTSWGSDELSALISSLPPSTPSRIQTQVVDLCWWSEDHLLLAFATGEVIISSLSRLQNLLGLSGAAEIFEKHPSVSSTVGSGAFILECRQQSVAVVRNLTSTDRLDRRREPQQQSTFRWLAQWLRDYAWEIAEHFWSPDWWLNSLSGSMMRRLNLRKTYRLLNLRSTTPLKLCLKLLQSDRYEDALNLAQVYNLNTDLVYQKQWAAVPVSQQSIKDYLNRIYDQRWVLWECHRRVPNDPHAAELLLEYGLKHAVPTWVYEYRSTPEDNADSLTFTLTKSVSKRLSAVDKELCLHRLLFLQYLDRLHTFKRIIGDDHFLAANFLLFRSCELLAAAKDYARDENFAAVEVMLAHHLEALMPHLLEILSQCPETTSPSRYEQLLPPFLSLPESRPAHVRNPDWVEAEDILNALGVRNKDDPRHLYSLLRAYSTSSSSSSSPSTLTHVATDIGSLDFKNSADVYFTERDLVASMPVISSPQSARSGTEAMELSSEEVEHWYRQRVQEIDDLSGQLENALTLINCGLKKGVSGLQPVLNDLISLSTLVYGEAAESLVAVPTTGTGNAGLRVSEATKDSERLEKHIYISFRNFHALSNDEKLRILLADSTDVSLMHNLKTRALPFLQRLSQHTDRSSSASSLDNELLRRWMVNMAQGDRLHWCALIIQASRPIKDNPEENRIIRRPAELMRAALDVVYVCPTTSAQVFQQMAIIFESLPERAVGTTHIAELALHAKIDRMEKHLNANETLLKYELAQPMVFFLNYEDDRSDDSVPQALLHRMAQFVVRGGKEGQQVWVDLLRDMLSLRDQVFTSIDEASCYRLFCSTLLHTGQFDLASEYMRQLSHATAEELALEAARLHFNSAASPHHREMSMAKKCLTMVPLTAKIAAERDLIEGVKLLDKLGLHLLPVQMRLRLNAVEQLIAQLLANRIEAYKEVEKLQHVASLLGVSMEVRQKINVLIAQAAYEQSDYEVARAVCDTLMAMGNVEVRTICANLARAHDYRDIKARLSMLSFALSHCELNETKDLLDLYCQLEAWDSARITIASSNSEECDATTPLTELRAQLELMVEPEPVESARKRGPVHFYPCYPFYDETPLNESMLEGPRKEAPEQILLRLPLDADEIRKLLIRSARNHALVDLPLALSYLAASGDEEIAKDLLDDLAQRARDKDWDPLRKEEEQWRLAGCYYFALHCLSYLYSTSLVNEYDRTRLFYGDDMANVVHRLQEMLESHTLGHISLDTSPVAEALSQFKQCYARLCTARQERQLAEMSGGVDKERLTKDEGYGKEVLLGLGRTSKKASLTVAFSLARRYSFPEHLLALEAVEFCLREEASHQVSPSLLSFLSPRLRGVTEEIINDRMQQLLCSGVKITTAMQFLRTVSSCCSTLPTPSPSVFAQFYQSAVRHVLTSTLQNIEGWQNDLLSSSFQLSTETLQSAVPLPIPTQSASSLNWPPSTGDQLLQMLFQLFASLDTDAEESAEIGEYIAVSQRSVTDILHPFLLPPEDTEESDDNPALSTLPQVQGRIIVLESLIHWQATHRLGEWWRHSAKEEPADLTPDAALGLLIQYRTLAILLSTWPDHCPHPLAIFHATTSERLDLFMRLCSLNSTSDQVKSLAQLLLCWSRDPTQTVENKNAWSAAWAHLFNVLVRLKEYELLIAMRREAAEALNQEEEQTIARQLADAGADSIYFKFSLSSRFTAVIDAGVDALVRRAAAAEEQNEADTAIVDDRELLSIVVDARLLPRFVNNAVYFPRLVSFLLSLPHNRRMPGSEDGTEDNHTKDKRSLQSVAVAAASLCASGQHAIAAGLVCRALSLATTLQTARNALALLARYLRAHIDGAATHDSATRSYIEAALQQLLTACPYLPVVVAGKK